LKVRIGETAELQRKQGLPRRPTRLGRTPTQQPRAAKERALECARNELVKARKERLLRRCMDAAKVLEAGQLSEAEKLYRALVDETPPKVRLIVQGPG